jgi:hypothetical protein
VCGLWHERCCAKLRLNRNGKKRATNEDLLHAPARWLATDFWVSGDGDGVRWRRAFKARGRARVPAFSCHTINSRAACIHATGTPGRIHTLAGCACHAHTHMNPTRGQRHSVSSYEHVELPGTYHSLESAKQTRCQQQVCRLGVLVRLGTVLAARSPTAKRSHAHTHTASAPAQRRSSSSRSRQAVIPRTQIGRSDETCSESFVVWGQQPCT